MTSSPANPLLEVQNLSVAFQQQTQRVPVVREVSFRLEAGKTLCLVGESGCGKSLTALALLGLLPQNGRCSGSVRLAGKELTTLTESELRPIRGKQAGMIFQEPMTALNPVLRAGDQVAEILMLHHKLSRRQALEQTVSLFTQVGIPAPERRIREYPHQLSGGMRQRVMIAMALACEPLLLIADEPTTALDVTIQGQILALLREQAVRRGMGLLLITHDLGVVAEMADEVGVMYAGRLVEKAPVQALFAHPTHPYTRGLMHSVPTLDLPAGARLEAIPGTVPTPGSLPEGCAFRPRCPQAHERCFSEPPDVPTKGAHTVRCWLAEHTATTK